jgi:uncharacterized protein YjgD (DUF1641 family)
MSVEEQSNLSATEKLTQDPMTAEGLSHLIDKIAPLIQAKRLDNIVDLLSMISDNIDFVDETTAEKLSKTIEEVMGSAWMTANALRMAKATVEKKETPATMFQLLKQLNDKDVRRGIDFFLSAMKVFGKQLK